MCNKTKCIRCGVAGSCPRCSGILVIKSGKTAAGKQRFFCKNCRRRFITAYTYAAYHRQLDNRMVILLKEGLGIRSIARVLSISTTTLSRRLRLIAKGIKKPAIVRERTYEVDEMRSFLGNKKRLIWIVYALDRRSKQVADFNIGSRTNKTLKSVIKTLELSEAKRIYTDKLKNYKYLIGKKLHCVAKFQTNHIERMNLTLRTHLKRLNRRTICFSKVKEMPAVSLRIFFWNSPVDYRAAFYTD